MYMYLGRSSYRTVLVFGIVARLMKTACVCSRDETGASSLATETSQVQHAIMAPLRFLDRGRDLPHA